MKKITAILLSLLMILGVSVMVTSCDESPSMDTTFLVGTWEYTYESDGYTYIYIYDFTDTNVSVLRYMNNELMEGNKGTYTGNPYGVTLNFTEKYNVDAKSYHTDYSQLNLIITKVTDTEISINGITFTKQ